MGLLVSLSALSISHIFWHEQEQGNAIHWNNQGNNHRVRQPIVVTAVVIVGQTYLHTTQLFYFLILRHSV